LRGNHDDIGERGRRYPRPACFAICS
jgi:hypothetical protein